MAFHPLRLARPGNAALAAVGTTVGGIAAAGTAAEPLSLALAAAAAALGVAGGNALNDARDASIDRFAHPLRPVASGRITHQRATWFGLTWLATAVALGALVGYWALLLAVLLAANLVLYEYALKGRAVIGHVIVSYNAGALFLLGGLAALAPAMTYRPDLVEATIGDPRLLRVLVMALLAGALNLAREFYKSAEDAAHDRKERRTYAVQYGAAHANRVAAAICWLLIPLSVAPYWVGWFPVAYVWALSPLLLLLVAVPFANAPGTARAWLKMGMVLGLFPFLATALL